MIRAILSGCGGQMGRVITSMCENDPEIEIVAGVDVSDVRADYPVYKSFDAIKEEADVLIDFSSSTALDSILPYCIKKRVPAVICSTGHSDEQLDSIKKAADVIPMFKSGNMSLGINLLCELIKQSAAVLGLDFDIEVIEKHHNKKIDAPSGTAYMLAEAAEKGLGSDMEYVYDRHAVRERRNSGQIGISSVRGGSIPGEHTVIFAGKDEVIEFKHTIYSREVFAVGALRAAKYLAGKKEPGMYDMGDVIANN
jgi:4-hydroxy-tetrahydrodipicolinate reductase